MEQVLAVLRLRAEEHQKAFLEKAESVARMQANVDEVTQRRDNEQALAKQFRRAIRIIEAGWPPQAKEE